MAPFFKSNHLKLIDACYAVDLNSSDLPSAVSNSLGKLTFYASGRPKKLPKVSLVLIDRVEKYSKSAHQNLKARNGLGVSLDIMRGLVVECRDELSCFANLALKAVELGLTRKQGDKRDIALEARAASLFHAVSTYLTAPFQGLNDETGKLYLRCLALISALAQLSNDQSASRSVALMAIKGTIASELLYSASSDYDSLVEEIAPALLFNCFDVSVDELNSASEKESSTLIATNLGPLSSRKSSAIEPPSNSPTVTDLSSQALIALRSLAHSSHGAQLTSMLSAMGTYLDRHRSGALWNERALVEWLGNTTISATPIQYRATVISWWLEQIVEIDDSDATPKSETLLYTLSQILRGPTSLVGLGIGGILNQLTSLVVQRSPLGDKDPLAKPLLSTISSLASSHVYYVDQVNDVVSDLIETIRSVRDGTGVAARLNERERVRALRQLSGALKQVLLEAAKSSDVVKIAVPAKATTNGINGDVKGKKESKKDSLGRPVMNVADGGKRNRLSPEVFIGSLFLLTQSDAITRTDYERALLLYVANELHLPEQEEDAAVDTSSSLAKFCKALFTAVHELAVSSSLKPAVNNFGRSTSRRTSNAAASVKSGRSRRRRSSSAAADSISSVASAADYAALVEILRAFQARKSATAVVTVLPMLFALQKNANRWLPDSDASTIPMNQPQERAQACREIVAQTLYTIGDVWDANQASKLADKALNSMTPSVLPRLGAATSGEFAARATNSNPTIDLSAIVEALTANSGLQASAGPNLGHALSQPWTPEILIDGGRIASGPYGNGNRSVTNLSSAGLNRANSTAGTDRRSLRAPSLVDLQQSLGSRGASSAGASIASTTNQSLATNGGGVNGASGRRTQKAKAATVLDGLRQTAEKRASVILPQGLRVEQA